MAVVSTGAGAGAVDGKLIRMEFNVGLTCKVGRLLVVSQAQPEKEDG